MDVANTCYEQCRKLHLDDLIRKRVSATAGSQEAREAQALSWIGWGFYVHENHVVGPMNRRKTLRKPDIPKLWQGVAQSLPEEESNDYWWFAYPVSLTPQMSFRKKIFEAECDLIEIFEDIMDFLVPRHSDADPFKAPDQVLKLYRRLIALKYSLPEFLQAESSTLPAALQFYVNFDLILMSVLRPFYDVAKDQFGGLDPKATSQFYASHIMSTIWTFRALYTVRHEFLHTLPCSVCAFRVVDDRNSGPMQVETFMKACQLLNEMMERFRLPVDVLAFLKTALKNRRIIQPSSTVGILEAEIEAPGLTMMQYTVAAAAKEQKAHSRSRDPKQVRILTVSDMIVSKEIEITLD
ncbi:hypothetical protein FOQG_16508 [Fusarium oxysporum f. sp. raphani 54005]|uniref:Transcription factor domain-containing protein n=1 Tax=Fusarium oxysporum f. sp. raphani 54005 TaxID=1089458 RepID=X0C803_FUSOX|nr:hypothetical protein FOQG_16508 [Fusarium oxysporum f. sp. raphani 54005]